MKLDWYKLSSQRQLAATSFWQVATGTTSRRINHTEPAKMICTEGIKLFSHRRKSTKKQKMSRYLLRTIASSHWQ